MNEPSRQPKIGEPYTPNYDEPPYSKAGVDLTLIRWMLSLTPLERLLTAQRATQSILKLKKAGTQQPDYVPRLTWSLG